MTIQDLYIPSVNEAVKLIVLYYRNNKFAELKTIKEYLATENTSRYIAGDADSFHNATVALTRIGFFDYAYALAELGHKRYPKNTDLLGDLLCYGLQCRSFLELEQWYDCLTKIDFRFWTWRAYQFSFDYWMERLPDAKNDEQTMDWENKIEFIFTNFKENFRFLKDKSDYEKAYMMEYEFYASKGEEEKSVQALEEATENEKTKNKCPQCALKLADHYFELGNYENAFKYANIAVMIKEDQPSINLGYAHYIRAMSKEFVERQNNSYKQNIQDIYNAYASAYLHLKDESDRQRLIDSVKKQVSILERETDKESHIVFSDSSMDKESLLRILGQLSDSGDSETQ